MDNLPYIKSAQQELFRLRKVQNPGHAQGGQKTAAVLQGEIRIAKEGLELYEQRLKATTSSFSKARYEKMCTEYRKRLEAAQQALREATRPGRGTVAESRAEQLEKSVQNLKDAMVKAFNENSPLRILDPWGVDVGTVALEFRNGLPAATRGLLRGFPSTVPPRPPSSRPPPL